MFPLKIFEVGFDGFHWRVSQRGLTYSVPFPLKQSAITAARELALASQMAQVVVRAPGGQIEAQWSYFRNQP